MDYIFEFNVKTPTIFSDHSPICLILENLPFVTYTNDFQNEDGIDLDKNHNPHSFYNLNDENSALFLSRLSDDFCLYNLNAIIDVLHDSLNNDNEIIDKCIHALQCIIDYAAKPFLVSINKPYFFSPSTKKNNEWYDKECKQMKEKFDLAIDIFKETNNDDDLKSLCTIRNNYRSLCRNKNRKQRKASSKFSLTQ